MCDMTFVFRLANAYCIQQYGKAKRTGDIELSKYWKAAYIAVNETIEQYKKEMFTNENL